VGSIRNARYRRQKVRRQPLFVIQQTKKFVTDAAQDDGRQRAADFAKDLALFLNDLQVRDNDGTDEAYGTDEAMEPQKPIRSMKA